MRISESQPLPPGWVERYDEQGNVWFDIRDDERSEPPESEPAPSVPPTTQPPMASMSFAQRLYASALPADSVTSQHSHPHHQPHRASTYQPPSVPPPVPDNYRHHQRATTYSSSFAVTNSARTSENLTSAPRSTPTVALVARAPASGQVPPTGQHSLSAANPRSPSHETPMPLSIPRHPNSTVASPPPAPQYQTQANPPIQQPTGPRRYSTGPLSPPPPHPSTASSRYSSGPPLPPPSTASSRPVHSAPMPPPQRTPSMQPFPPPPPRPPVMQHSSPPSRPPVMQHSPPPPPPPPPIQQQQTQRPLPTSSTQPNDRGLMTDVGKAVGSMALKSVGGAMLSALTGGLLSSDVVDGLSTIFSGMGIGGDATASVPTSFGFDFSQLQAVAQGQPGADYQSIIDSILQTQQQQPQQQSSGIDYQAIISELLKIQKQSTHPPVAYQPPAVYHPPSFQSAPAPDFAAMYNQSYQNGMQQTIQIMEDAMKPNPYLQQQMQGQSQQTIQMLQYIEQQQLQAKQNLIDMMKAQNAALFGAAPSVREHQSYYGGGQPSFGGSNGHALYGHGHSSFAPGHTSGGHPPQGAHTFGSHPQYGHHHSYTR